MFKTVFYSKMGLEFKKTSSNKRAKNTLCALLKFVFNDNSIGYSSFTPWVHLGDKDLDSQILLLKKRKLTALTEKSLFHARLDAHYRTLHKNPFSRFKKFLKTNFLIPLNELSHVESGKCYKVKLGSDKKNELDILASLRDDIFKSIRLRIDFEGLLDFENLFEYLPYLNKFKSQIDYMEDPLKNPSQKLLEKLKNLTDIPLAIDRVFVPEDLKKDFDYGIIKPSKDSLSRLYDNNKFKNIVFTSYMDNELSILASYYEALDFYEKSNFKEMTCGFSTFLLLRQSPFKNAFRLEDSVLIPNYEDREGFAPKELLESLSWSQL